MATVLFATSSFPWAIKMPTPLPATASIWLFTIRTYCPVVLMPKSPALFMPIVLSLMFAVSPELSMPLDAVDIGSQMFETICPSDELLVMHVPPDAPELKPNLLAMTPAAVPDMLTAVPEPSRLRPCDFATCEYAPIENPFDGVPGPP